MSDTLTVTRSPLLREQTTEAILAKFADSGIDQFIVADYCAIEGVSRPTFYSRFGSVHGLAAEIWIERGRAWLDRLVSENFSPTASDVGMALIMAVARRSSEISEVVVPYVNSWWNSAITARAPEAISWLMGNRLGTLLTIDTDQGAVAALALDPAILAVDELRLAEMDDVQLPLELSNPAFDDPILDAAYTVIGNVGYHGASLTRIARAAKFTTGAVYPQFGNAEDVVETAYQMAQAQIVTSNTALWKTQGLSIESFGAFVHLGLQPSRVRWRRLRLETFIAARPPRTKLANLASESLVRMVGGVDEAIQHVRISPVLQRTVAYFFHTLGVGLSVLKELQLPISDLNHVGMTRQIVGRVVGTEASTAN
jgi:AcrR family transcriptional regulator